MSQKHAYLFLVHNMNLVFEKCICLLDHPKNDIFLHVDRKCRDFDIDYYKGCLRYSKIYMTDRRYNCTWGGYSLLLAEMELIKCAYFSNMGYKCFHLLSGADMPLVSQDTIHSFFEANKNAVCLDISDVKPGSWQYRRVDVYRFFGKYAHRRSKCLNMFFCNMERVSAFLQRRIMKIDIVKRKNINLKFGSQWWSLPNNAVECLIEKENRIEECFRFSNIPDELFVQTILSESGFIENIHSNKRFIRWTEKRAHPDILTMEDYDDLRNSGCFFARKFDENEDMGIVNKIYYTLLKKDK